MRSVIRCRLVPIVVLAVVLILGLSATVFAATPANNGQGQTYGLHHAECAEAGMLGADCNPGMHQGIAGWNGPCAE